MKNLFEWASDFFSQLVMKSVVQRAEAAAALATAREADQLLAEADYLEADRPLIADALRRNAERLLSDNQVGANQPVFVGLTAPAAAPVPQAALPAPVAPTPAKEASAVSSGEAPKKSRGRPPKAKPASEAVTTAELFPGEDNSAA